MKLLCALLLCLASAIVYAGQENLCSGLTTTTSSTGRAEDTTKTFLATVTGTGAVSATVAIEGSMDNTNFDATAIMTLAPSGTTTAVDSATDSASSYAFYRCRVTAISGTGATVAVAVRSRSP